MSGTQKCHWAIIYCPKPSVAYLVMLALLHGHYTNHSLRATAATRMFNAGVDEQLMMHRRQY